MSAHGRIGRPRRGRVVVAIVVAGWAFASGAAPAATRPLAVTPELHRGWIGLRIAGGVPGSDATVRDRGGVVAHIRLGIHGSAAARDVLPWSCARRERRLTVTDGTATATATVTTPSCRHRVAVSILPRRPRAGRPLRLVLRDRWRVGRPAVRACLLAPAGSRPCVRAQLEPAARLRLTAPRPGRWRLELRGSGISETRRLRVLPHDSRLRILAAGDSLMEQVASSLTELLTAHRQAVVRTDVLYGAGLSDSTLADWRHRIRRDTGEFAPDVVVLFMGGGDTYPIGPIRCCGRRWRAAYGERARQVAVNAMRGGAAQVYWLTLPAPEDPDQAVDWAKENAGRAGGLAALAPWTTQIDTSALLTPGYVFRRTMIIDGRETTIRTDDGMHLTPPAGRLVADQVEAAMRSDAILPGAG